VGVAVWGLDESRNQAGYGYYTGGYYYQESYYAGSAHIPARGISGGEHLSGSADGPWAIPQASPVRRSAAVLGRILTGVLAFLAMLAIAAVIAYFADVYFAWGLGQFVSGLLGS
jgi:hypothetical protein